jgi:hypothetical protein
MAISKRRTARRYVYKGESHATERDMVLHLLDEFRCTEAFGAEYVPLWIETSDQDWVRGGLRLVQQREDSHARLMEERLRELGGVPRCVVPPEVRKRKLAFYGSTELKDAGKLKDEAAEIGDPEQALKVYTDVIDQIDEDQETKALLHWIVEDERTTIRWVMESCARSNPARPT